MSIKEIKNFIRKLSNESKLEGVKLDAAKAIRTLGRIELSIHCDNNDF